jgi:hypothetical protein
LPKGSSRKTWIQVGTRVPPEVNSVLTLAATFQDTSIQELLYPLVEQLAKSLAAEPEIKTSLNAMSQYRARKRARVVELTQPPSVPR